jgi:hypothetical protein
LPSCMSSQPHVGVGGHFGLVDMAVVGRTRRKSRMGRILDNIRIDDVIRRK